MPSDLGGDSGFFFRTRSRLTICTQLTRRSPEVAALANNKGDHLWITYPICLALERPYCKKEWFRNIKT